MRINHNIPALYSYNAQNVTQEKIEKAIQKLSTGLRINSAADDAAGLGISEKMRSQIRGLAQASRNAQDGISMVQTAEGALSEIHSMLHRMRELSVQAANDTLTSQDREFIQLEIDKLKDAIDRIAETTQFNKRRLLNGESDAQWSASNLGMRAIIRGGFEKEAEGNFRVSVSVLDTGNAEIKKSNIFDAYIEPGVLAGRVVGMGYSLRSINMTQTYNINNINPGVAGAGKGIFASRFQGYDYSCSHTFLYGSPVGNARAGRYVYDFPPRQIPPDLNDLPVVRKISAYGMSVDDIFIDDSDPVALFGADFDNIPNTNIIFEAVAIHEVEEAVTFKVISRRFSADDPSNPLPDVVSFITINTKGITGGVLDSGVVTVHGEGAYSVGLYDELGINLMPDQIKLNKDYNMFKVGDSFHLNITPPLHNSGRLSLRATGPAGDQLYYVLDSSFQNGRLDVPFLSIDTTNGNIYNASFRTEFSALPYPHGTLYWAFTLVNDGDNAVQTVDINTTMEITYDFERKYKTLGDIYRNVNFPQSLTLYQGGLTAVIALYAGDTFYDFAQRLNNAIAFGLDNAKYANSSTQFAVVAGGGENTPESLGVLLPIGEGIIWRYSSTIVINSAKPGKDGIIHFSGDEEFLKAFGLNVIQESRESIYGISVYDAHDGKMLVSDAIISGNTAYGLVNKNVDFAFDPMRHMDALWNSIKRKFELRAKSAGTEEILHIAHNSTILQVGANEKDEMGISFGDIGSRALGLSNLLLLSNKLSEEAITTIDRAISRVSSIRALLGAHQNRLEHTLANLTTAATNVTTSESRIRDSDMAKEMLEYTKLSILVQSGAAMITQANQLPQAVLSLLR